MCEELRTGLVNRREPLEAREDDAGSEAESCNGYVVSRSMSASSDSGAGAAVAEVVEERVHEGDGRHRGTERAYESDSKTLANPGCYQPQEAPSSTDRCLSNDELLSFVQGRLGDHQLDRMHAHVDGCAICQRLVVEAVHALDAEPISESDSPSWNTVFQANMIVGKRYRVLRLVARGGMGEVYEAFDTALHERVALKTVTSTSCDSIQAVRYLKAEVQLARRISHPNVCRIYDLGTHVIEPSKNEIFFLVMEFVEGECLGKRLRQQGPLSIDQANSVARQLLLGLRAAHQAGILHRDFKSDNVMLRHEGNGQVTPVILDFGLARALNESGSIATTRGQGQAMVGTIGYMAPEQIEGEPLSTASDVYAFGVVWFEMLTGRLPFSGETPVASAIARLHRPPVAPSTLHPKVPPWLDDIVLRCLNRHRSNRFARAEQVLEALLEALKDAPPSSLPEAHDRRYHWRSWLAAALTAAAGLSIAIASLTNTTRVVTTGHLASPVVLLPNEVANDANARLTSSGGHPAVIDEPVVPIPTLVTPVPAASAPSVRVSQGSRSTKDVRKVSPRRSDRHDEGSSSVGQSTAAPLEPAPPPKPNVVQASNDALPGKPAGAAHGAPSKETPAVSTGTAKRAPDWLPIWTRPMRTQQPNAPVPRQ